MNINYSKGSSPGGICRYLLNEQKQKQAEQNPILETNMSGRDAEELAEEFRFSHDLNRRVEQTMVHYSVSLPAGEKVRDEQIGQISRGLLEKTGHSDCQYFVVRHHDREQHNDVAHWHVLTSAVDLKGQWVDGRIHQAAAQDRGAGTGAVVSVESAGGATGAGTAQPDHGRVSAEGTNREGITKGEAVADDSNPCQGSSFDDGLGHPTQSRRCGGTVSDS